MNRLTPVVLGLWAIALAAFFVAARPAAGGDVTYQAEPLLADWVAGAAALEARASRATIRPAGPGARPDLTVGRLRDGANIATTRLIVAAWQGSPAESVANPERLGSWLAAVRAGRVRFAVPGPNSAIGRDFVALARPIDAAAEADFYRSADRLRDRDDLYIDDVRNLGPARWDAAFFYEAAALQINKARSDQGVQPLLRIYYLENAPQVAFQADGTEAGDRLIAGLASPAAQSLALDHGLRPLDPAAQSAGSLFTRFAAQGARLP